MKSRILWVLLLTAVTLVFTTVAQLNSELKAEFNTRPLLNTRQINNTSLTLQPEAALTPAPILPTETPPPPTPTAALPSPTPGIYQPANSNRGSSSIFIILLVVVVGGLVFAVIASTIRVGKR